MKILPKPQPALKITNRAIKIPLKLLLLGVFIVFGLLFVNEAVLSITIFQENFETYNVGYDLNGQGNWISNDIFASSTIVSNAQSKGGEKSVYIPALNVESVRVGNSLATGTLTFWFYGSALTGANLDRAEIVIGEGITGYNVVMRFYCENNNNCDGITGILYSEASLPARELTIGTFLLETWNSVRIEWRATDNKVRYSLNLGDWSEWDYAFSGFNALNTIRLLGYDFSGSNKFILFVDDIAETDCSVYQTWLTCENAKCCWYWSYWFQQHFCVACPSGECGATPYDCGSCLTEGECNAQSFCYWFNGFCKFGTGVCGEGLMLQFCENQTECEDAGGYWYENYCWLEPAPTLIDWESYYAEFGDYATASAWIADLADTSAGFFAKIGGFLTAFEKNFDLKEAFERGKNFGSAIPIARGYLKILNDFVGGLPFGEFFIFILIFMLAIGVFRIVRNLIQVLKFW